MPDEVAPGVAGGGGHARERLAVGFACTLRAAGVDVATGSVVDFAAALALVGTGARAGVHLAGRTTLVRRPEDLDTYDRAFAAFWEGRVALGGPSGPPQAAGAAPDDGEGAAAPGARPPGPRLRAVRYSPTEVLAQRDFGSLDDDEWAEASLLLSALRVAAEGRRTRRLRPSRRRHGHPDLRATLRRAMRTGGVPVERAWRQPTRRPRRLVVLVDVSGSMEPYARACLRFAQAAVGARRAGGVEVFALGTRLTRLTRHLASHDPEVALRRASGEIADWSGGTRLGDGLGWFNERWGLRGMARGAVVVILSDGWDRGDPARLAEEMERLHRAAHRVVWVNPLKASPGYAPLARGMAAALPHVDEFVEGHSLASLAHLADIVAGRGGPRPSRVGGQVRR